MPQRPLTMSTGFQLEPWMEQRIAGADPVPAGAGRRVAGGAQRRIVAQTRPDTPAYEWAGGWPSPFDDWTAWTGVYNPLFKPSFLWKGLAPVSRIGEGKTREGGPVDRLRSGYVAFRNVPFFATERVVKTPRLPTWPDRRAPLSPAGVATHFRVPMRTRDDKKRAPVWPHVAASSSYGDAPVVQSRFLAVKRRALPSGRYVEARVARYPRVMLTSPSSVFPGAQYVVGVQGRPLWQEPSSPRGEVWQAPVRGLSGAGLYVGEAEVATDAQTATARADAADKRASWGLWLGAAALLLTLPLGLKAWRRV